MRKSRNSFYDAKGLLFVACADCDRGGNGQAEDKCSCGWQIRRGPAGCYVGDLMPDVEVVLHQTKVSDRGGMGVYELRTKQTREQ